MAPSTARIIHERDDGATRVLDRVTGAYRAVPSRPASPAYRSLPWVAVDQRKGVVRLPTLAILRPQPTERGRRAQLPPAGLLSPRDHQGRGETSRGLAAAPGAQVQLARQPPQLGLEPALVRRFNPLERTVHHGRRLGVVPGAC